MDLIWLDSNTNADPADDLYQRERGTHKVGVSFPEDSTLRVNFDPIGRGEKKKHSFAVEIDWLDVKGFVCEFIEMGHPEALCLQRMLKLAEAIDNAGWSPDDPPPDDFWQIMPQ
jgi:hypothetical protein